MSIISHIAVIPGRKGSKGFPHKNRLFFSLTANFVRNSGLFDKVIVNSDDEILLDMATAEGFKTYRRPDAIAQDNSSIRDVFLDLAANYAFNPEDYLWLFYIPFVYKDISDFRKARKIVDDISPPSLSAFVPAKGHPFNCWYSDEESGKIRKFIPNDYYNRQDYPEAWENHHYVFCIKVNELPRIDNNLLNENTYPLFFTPEESERLIEIDEPHDFQHWIKADPEAYSKWRESLPEDIQLPPEVKANL